MSDSKGEPEISEDAMNRLKAVVKNLNGIPLICALIFVEMSIRQQIYFDDAKMDYVGGTTYGAHDPDDPARKRRRK